QASERCLYVICRPSKHRDSLTISDSAIDSLTPMPVVPETLPVRRTATAKPCTVTLSRGTTRPHEVSMTLEDLRKRLSEVDRELIGLVAARQRIIADIGAHKIRNAVPTRDYEREREVLKSAQDQARALGLEPGLAREIMALLIHSSLAHQEQT